MLKKFKNITIKKLLISGAVIITLILVFIGFFTNYFVNNTLTENQIITSLKEIQNLELQIRKAEKEFLANETNNIDFHSSRQSKYIEEINFNLDKTHEHISILSETATIKELNKTQELNDIDDLFEQYQVYMFKMRDLVLKKGFKDYGLVGEMRDQIHGVEDHLKQENNHEFSVYMLTLRRHEKDYLLRKDLKYLEKFNSSLVQFKQAIKKQNNSNGKKLIGLLDSYSELFNRVIQVDVAIGLNANKGLNSNINETINKIEDNLNYLSSTIQTESKKKIDKTILKLFILIGLFSAIIIFVIYRTSKHVVFSINHLRKYITRLGKGELPEKIPIYNNDEIAQMKASVNELTKNLKNTKEFAIAVGNGQFNTEVNVFNNKGELGSALVEMREKLLQVSQEREEQIKEADERLWSNEGYNQIHDLLSKNQNLNHDFYYAIISKLTKYMGANQGTILVAEKENGEPVLVQKGTFAFDRNKINQKTIKLGEGIIGAVAFEKQTTYLKQLPENYINITSGLGDATPGFLLLVPCLAEGEIMGIIEIASFYDLEAYKIEFVEKVAADIATNIRKMQIEQTTRGLLEKTQRQTSELSEKEEEMRQNFEELQATQEAMETRETELLEKIKFLENDKRELQKKLNNQINQHKDEFVSTH